MNAHSPATRTTRDIARAVGNLVWTAAIVIGSPLVLARVFGYPLPRQMPDWGEVVSTPMQLVEPQVVINIVACLGWIAWGVVIGYVLVDVVDLARGVGHRVRRLGPASVVAGKLVASVALILSLLRQQPVGAAPARSVAVEQVVADPIANQPLIPLEVDLASSTFSLPAQTPAPGKPTPAATRTYLVQRGDSLWRIAEQQLGDGFRWREVYELNRHFISNPDLICTGWTLALPTDASSMHEATAQPASELPVPSQPTPVVPETETTAPEPAPTAETSTTTTTSSTAPYEPSTTTETTADPVPAPLPSTPTASEQPHETSPEPSPAIPGSSAESATPAPNNTESDEPTVGVPLWLRALGFNSRDEYDAWIAAHPEVRDTPTHASEEPAGTSRTVALSAIAGSTLAAGIVAAAVIRSLDRRRRRVLNRRPIGAPPPPRDPALQKPEQVFRANTYQDPDQQIACIDTVLRVLTTSFAASGTAPMLLLIRARTDGVELLWETPPVIEPPDGFSSEEAATSWLFHYPEDDLLADIRHQMVGQPYFAEALVTLGDTPEGPVLVNLAALETLDATGDGDSIEAWLSAVALELEAHSWADDVEIDAPTRTNVGAGRISAAIYITPTGSAHPYIQIADAGDEPEVTWQLEINRGHGQLRHPYKDFALELTPVGIDPDLGRLGAHLLLHADFDPYDGDGIRPSSTPTPEPPTIPEDDDRIDLETLKPDEIVIQPSFTTEEPASQRPRTGLLTGTLVHAKRHEAQAAIEAAGRAANTEFAAPVVGPTVEASEVLPATAAVDPISIANVDDPPKVDNLDDCTNALERPAGTLFVRMLGRPRVTGWVTTPKGNRPNEIVVYLAAARPAGVRRDRLMDALWNGERVKPKALYNHLAAIRRHSGDPDVVINDNSIYRLADCVRSDWDQFCELSDMASTLEGRPRLERLRDAVDLIDGAPFDGADSTYTWASGEGISSHIEVALTDLASILATEAIEVGDTTLAVFAARKGLLACPWLLRMFGYIIEAHSLDGNANLVEHAWREAIRIAGDDQLPEELCSRYEAARATTSERRA